jgi:hypothetical protein
LNNALEGSLFKCSVEAVRQDEVEDGHGAKGAHQDKGEHAKNSKGIRQKLALGFLQNFAIRFEKVEKELRLNVI